MMRRHVIRSIFIQTTIVVAFTTLTAFGAPRDKAANKAPEYDSAILIAPLNNMISLDAGTMEARFSLDYSFNDYLRPQSSYSVPFSFIAAVDKDRFFGDNDSKGPTMNIYLAQSQGNHTFAMNQNLYYIERPNPTEPNGPPIRVYYAGIGSNKEKGPWLLAGEWHNLAVTWTTVTNVLKIEMILNGKVMARQSYPVRTSGVSTFGKDELLRIGGWNLSPATLLAYRLSNRVRTLEEITSDKPLSSDDATTFLLNGDTASKMKVMKMSDLDAMRAQKKFNLTQPVFFGNMKIVNTPKGKAVQFYKTKSR